MAEKSRGNTTDINDAARLVSLMWKNRRFLVSSGRRAMYIGCVGNKNFGDDLIRVAIHDIFRDVCTFYSQPYHSVQQSDRLFFQVFVRNVEMPMVFLGGGTLIKSHGKSIYLSRIRQAQNRNSNTRLIVFGPGVEDIELAEKKGHKINTTPWVETLNQAEYIGVRGPLSKHALESWGVTQSVHIIGDPGIYYAPDALTPHPLGKRIGINLAGGLKNAHVFGHDVDRLSQTIMTFARRLLDSGWTITWFPTTQDDADEMRRLIARANLPPMAIMSDFLNIPAMLDRLKEQDIFVGQRLHSVVAASSVYVPVLALEYQLKCRDFMMSIDQEDAVIRTDTVEAAELFDRTRALYDHHEQVQQRVYQSVQSLRRNLLEGSRTVKSLIR